MKKLVVSLFMVAGATFVSAAEEGRSQNQFGWIQDLETLVKLDLQREDTLQGRDINSNGIRDDVESYVEQKFGYDPFQKEMFLEAAKKIQQIITLPENSSVQEHLKLDKELLSLYTCRDYILYREKEEQIEQEMLNKTLFKARVLNTKERLSAYIEHKKMLPLSYDDLTKESLKREKNACLAKYRSISNEHGDSIVTSSKGIRKIN